MSDVFYESWEPAVSVSETVSVACLHPRVLLMNRWVFIDCLLWLINERCLEFTQFASRIIDVFKSGAGFESNHVGDITSLLHEWRGGDNFKI